jgi:hypothetical protein
MTATPTGPPIFRKSRRSPEQGLNYLTVLIGYGEHAIDPLVQQWNKWSGTQRLIGVALLAPFALLPMLFIAFIVIPWMLIFAIAAYAAIFGWETTKRHTEEALDESGLRTGVSRSLAKVRKNAEELKEKAGIVGSGAVHKLIDSTALASHYTLTLLMIALDHVINGLLSVSHSLQKERIGGRSEKSSPTKNIRPAKPVLVD